MEENSVVIRYEELDDHGHSTLIIHGEPEIVATVMGVVLLTLGPEADEVRLLDPETGEAVSVIGAEEPEDLDGLADAA